MVVGWKRQTLLAGRPLQLGVSEPVLPKSEAMTKLGVATPPCGMVTVVLELPMAKSLVGTIAVDVEPAKLESPE